MHAPALAAFALAAPDRTRRPASGPGLMARDSAGTVWSHTNPAELYRWIARRNDLLSTIAVVTRGPAAGVGLRAN